MTDRQYFTRTLSYLKPYGLMYIFGLLIYSSQGFIFPFLSGIFMEGITAGILYQDFAIVISTLIRFGVMVLAILIALGISLYMYTLPQIYAERDLGLKLFNALIEGESTGHSGDGMAAITTDLSTTTNIFGNVLSPFVGHITALVFSAVVIFAIDYRLGLGVYALGVLVFIAQSRFARPLEKLGKARLEANASAVKSITNIFAGAITIRAFSKEDGVLIAFDHENGKLKKLQFAQAFIGTWQNLFTTAQGWLTLVVVFALGGWLVTQGAITLPQLMVVSNMAWVVGGAAAQIGESYAALKPPIVAAKRVFAIVDTPVVAPATTAFTGEIAVQNLDFAYPDAKKNTLHNINLTIAPGQTVAFVGESGSGKSTLLKCIANMYAPEDIAYVSQSYSLFNLTIAENIAMGLKGEATQAQVETAAKQAAAHEFIAALPEGYQTLCGENGNNLSGGQRQRVALARALCRNAPLLILDEATAALDPEAERQVMETIARLKGSCTILLITHHLQNAQIADRIVEMENGRIVAA